MAFPQTRLAVAVAVAGLGAVSTASTLRPPPASAGQSRTAPEGDAMQALADITLIESRCRLLNVDYGRLFAFAERNGISPAEIMPAGERRAAFEAAYQRRAREMKDDRLCGDLAAQRDATVPGIFTPR